MIPRDFCARLIDGGIKQPNHVEVICNQSSIWKLTFCELFKWITHIKNNIFNIFSSWYMSEIRSELGAIYVLEKFKGKKIGAALLNLGMKQLLEWKYSKAYCWVLEGNPTIEFYKKSGAVFNGMEKPDEIGGKKVKELCYEWKDLNRFY